MVARPVLPNMVGPMMWTGHRTFASRKSQKQQKDKQKYSTGPPPAAEIPGNSSAAAGLGELPRPTHPPQSGDGDGLLVEEFDHSNIGKFASIPRGLGSAKWQAGVGGDHCVYERRARVNIPDGLFDFNRFIRPN